MSTCFKESVFVIFKDKFKFLLLFVGSLLTSHIFGVTVVLRQTRSMRMHLATIFRGSRSKIDHAVVVRFAFRVEYLVLVCHSILAVVRPFLNLTSFKGMSDQCLS